MTMPSPVLVGNDIVDLDTPHAWSRHRDGRFMGRTFTDEEARSIAAAADPHRHLWSLWAAKETAYKIMAKSMPDVTAWPSRYETCLIEGSSGSGFLEGVVRSPGGAVTVCVHSGDSHVHCVGTSGGKESLEKITFGTGLLGGGGESESPSEAARRLIIENLSHDLGIAPRRMCIVRCRGSRGLLHPLLLIDGEQSTVDISISHDGLFAGYARRGTGAGF